jgi:phosphoribosylaminoimidazole-succinocarboxamide synthase
MTTASHTEAVLETSLDLPVFSRGKVRDTYDLGDRLLMVATDRISAYDVVLPSGIPDKGRVLTQISAHWFALTRERIPNHLITTDISGVQGLSPEQRAQLDGRTMVVRRAQRLDAECVVRGYLAGSGWSDYQRSGAVCGIELPAGLRESDRLPQPLFTPATKADTGHDENISFEQLSAIVGPAMAARLRDASLALYSLAAAEAERRGIILADTKFEFGLVDGELTLIDEALTPDSSRFWDVSTYQPGRAQPSFDKQFVRDYLAGLDWDRTPPGPMLPAEIIEGTRARYLDAFRRLTGNDLV